jgi:V8-like Glu-specific endopeptidase
MKRLLSTFALVLTILCINPIKGWAVKSCPIFDPPNTWTNCIGEKEVDLLSNYRGGFRNGKFHGEGTLTRPDGTVQEGRWKDGEFVSSSSSKKSVSNQPKKSSQSVVSEQPKKSPQSGDSDMLLANVAETYKHAVGLVVVGGIPAGTAWAVGPNKFATNGHVVQGVSNLIELFKKRNLSAGVYIAINQKKDLIYTVNKLQTNSLFGKRKVNYEGQKSLPNYDTGFLYTDEKTPIYFQLANIQTLKNLRAGIKIGYLGFPMEKLMYRNTNLSNPIATMQTGIITSVSNYFMENKAPKYFIRHNLPATGGSSGSPIFAPNGEVVGILWGGNNTMDQLCFERQIAAKKSVRPCRNPNAAMINFAERADLLYADKWKWKTQILD